ncbi:MAG TPA: hypothetical protein ENI05_04200 [Porticoccus sp.]|nr:hypothetical protein [Porticoccus sp.]
MTDGRFKEVVLRGSPEDIGFQHGYQLKDRIEKTLEYYLSLFNLPESKLFKQAETFKQIIADFNPRYSQEIEAVAEGAGLDNRYIYALNSRSEILNNLSIPECTTVFNQSSSLLAQNWDWSETLEPLVTLLNIEYDDGHRISMLTEPGIIGKIGMNSAGLGVCLNILKINKKINGLPVHILLRAILDCKSMVEVKALISRVSVGKASHVLVANSEGDYLSVEFAGDRHFELPLQKGLLVHTNHYLADTALNTVEAFPSTHDRYRCANRLLDDAADMQGFTTLMLDQSEGLNSICRPYSASTTPNFGNVGTVFSVLMDLSQRALFIRPGSSQSKAFYRIVC